MLAEFADFRWHVFSGGYVCADYKNPKGIDVRVVVPNWAEEGFLTERYPLEAEHPLYRTFADLEVTEEAILAFAKAWGPLKNAHEFEVQDFGDEVEMTGWVGDPLDDWFTEIKRMNALVELWDHLQGGMETKLSDVIDLEHSGDESLWEIEIAFKRFPALRRNFQFSERNWPGFSDLLEMGGKRELARMCLVELVNDSLWGSCSPWLSMSEDPKELTFCFTPHHLGAAMWLMFAQEILGEKTLKRCLSCKKYFEVSTEKGQRRQRSDKKYCSPKCRAAAFRGRGE